MDNFDKLIKKAVDKKFDSIDCNPEIEWDNFKKESMLNKKNKRIYPFIIAAALAIFVCTTALAQDNIKSELRKFYENTLQNLLAEKERIQSTIPMNEEEREQLNKDAYELKQKFLELDEIADQVKTQEEFAEELKSALRDAKIALEDVKRSNSYQTDEETKRFVENMEKKVARIEKDFEEGNKTPEQLLKELRDRSDVDN